MKLLHVNVEPTNKCQLNCSYCGDRKTREIGLMTGQTYKKILEMLPHPVEIRLFLSGEPFLHPCITTMALLALECHNGLLIHSNGLALSDDIISGLLFLGKKYPGGIRVVFSMHAKKITDEMRNFVEMNKVMGEVIDIVFQVIIPEPDPLEVPEYLKGEDFKIDLKRPHNWDQADSIEGSVKQDYKPPCGFLEDSLSIYWNGDVTVCCADLNGDRIIGHIDDGYDAITEKLDNICKLQREGKECPPCKGCERYG
jgi:hypothetical protein